MFSRVALSEKFYFDGVPVGFEKNIERLIEYPLYIISWFRDLMEGK